MSVAYPEGTFNLDAPIRQESDAVYEGAGIGKTILKTNGQLFAHFIAIGEAENPLRNITVRNMTLDGGVSVPDKTKGYHAWYVDYCDGIVFENVECINLWSCATHMRRSNNIEIRNIKTKNTWTGVCLWTVKNAKVHHSIIDTTHGDGAYLGYVYPCSLGPAGKYPNREACEAAGGYWRGFTNPINQHIEFAYNELYNIGDTGLGSIDISSQTTPIMNNDDVQIHHNLIDGGNPFSRSCTPNATGIAIGLSTNSRIHHNITKNMFPTTIQVDGCPHARGTPYPGGVGIHVGHFYYPPNNTYINDNTIINCDYENRNGHISAWQGDPNCLPPENIYGNIINPSPLPFRDDFLNLNKWKIINGAWTTV